MYSISNGSEWKLQNSDQTRSHPNTGERNVTVEMLNINLLYDFSVFNIIACG